MKLLYFLPVFLWNAISFAQSAVPVATATPPAVSKKTPKLTKADTVGSSYVKHITLATISLGFIDFYRRNITVPAGFQENGTTGFVPVYARLEYGITNAISIAAMYTNDVFYNSYYQVWPGYGADIKRYNTDRTNITRGGLSAYYHFGKFIQSKKLDVFAGVGLFLNSVRHSAAPQGDSTIVSKENTVSPYLKIGARYYFRGRGSVYADAGYDRQSIFSVGYSCRFFRK